MDKRLLLLIACVAGGYLAGMRGMPDVKIELPEMLKQIGQKEEARPGPTNALCGRCSKSFWASWASVCTCPHCGYRMNAAMAKHQHGPEEYPARFEPPSKKK